MYTLIVPSLFLLKPTHVLKGGERDFVPCSYFSLMELVEILVDSGPVFVSALTLQIVSRINRLVSVSDILLVNNPQYT